MKISLVATDSLDDWLQVWQSWLQIELDELYRLHWSVFQNNPPLCSKNAKYYPKYPQNSVFDQPIRQTTGSNSNHDGSR